MRTCSLAMPDCFSLLSPLQNILMFDMREVIVTLFAPQLLTSLLVVF